MKTTIERQLIQYEGLIRATTIRLLRKYSRERRDALDDYLAEARIAAWRALALLTVS